MLKKNEKYTVAVSGYTSEGYGVARIDGQVVFIPEAIEGELCEIRIEKVMKSFSLAGILEIKKPSPNRVRSTCKYARDCGGCAFLHMDYEEELRLKAQRVRDALERIGGFELPEVKITGADSIFGYRNKAQYPVALCKGQADAGFFRQKTHEVIPVTRCRIQMESAESVRKAVVEWMRDYAVAPYDEKTKTGLIRHIYVRTGAVSGQILACLVAAADKLPREKELVKRLQEKVPGLTSLVLSIHKEAGNVVLGREYRTLFGPGTIEDTLCGLRFRLSPQSFYQVNHDQAERLYLCAQNLAALTGKETVLDLYCGTGTITLCLAKEAKQVIGVEIIESAIRDANENAERNGIGNSRFFCADAGEAAKRLAEEGVHPDVIVMDPPRKGVSLDVIDAIFAMKPERIVYVSCDPATLARDLKALAEQYRLEHAEAFDMFPRCAHVETVCLMSRKDN